MMTPDHEELLTLAETINVLGISKQTLYRMMDRGALKGVKVGRQWRFRQADLDAYLNRGPAAQAVTTASADLVDDELAFFYGQVQQPVPALTGDLDPADEKLVLLVNSLFLLAIAQRASDIHLEPLRDAGVVRIRIDGVLHEARRMPADVFRGVIVRLKIMCNMNLEIIGAPQDGRIQIRANQRAFDLRMNIIPAVFGESAVLRILDQSSVLIGLEKLEFFPDDEARLRHWCGLPSGLLLFTGPTGSGKTTTMYSCLQTVQAETRKVLTIEDPVEYLLPGIVQSAVNRRNNYTFVTALRAFLRQDPDVIMVGEVRDRETLEIAIQAALTGHLLLTTLHTRDAVEALTRMVDIGAEPFLIASSVAGILAQRLARKLCSACKQPAMLPKAVLDDVCARAAAGGFTAPNDVVFYQAVGCDQCAHRGFRGRTALYELLEMTPAVRDAFLSKAPKADIVAAAVAEGMHTLFADGIRKAAAGMTTIEEVLRVVAS
jgi:excisionase family DNA binding protein